MARRAGSRAWGGACPQGLLPCCWQGFPSAVCQPRPEPPPPPLAAPPSAKFITGSVAQLLAKPEGGAAWLQGLRSVPYDGEHAHVWQRLPCGSAAACLLAPRPPACSHVSQPAEASQPGGQGTLLPTPLVAEACEALCTLPGIGPKVAACICLFSLDKHEAIPGGAPALALRCAALRPWRCPCTATLAPWARGGAARVCAAWRRLATRAGIVPRAGRPDLGSPVWVLQWTRTCGRWPANTTPPTCAARASPRRCMARCRWAGQGGAEASPSRAGLGGAAGGAVTHTHRTRMPTPNKQAAFVERFGPYAGWAHNTLFISELASTRDKVPAIGASSKGRGAGKRKAADGSSSEEEGSTAADSGDEGSAASSYSAELRGGSATGTPLPHTPDDGEAAAGRRPRRRAARKATAAAAD